MKRYIYVVTRDNKFFNACVQDRETGEKKYVMMLSEPQTKYHTLKRGKAFKVAKKAAKKLNKAETALLTKERF